MIAGAFPTVLNVHGDGPTRDAVSRMLGGGGLRSREAATAAEARAVLACGEADPAGVVLLDAGLDGAEPLCRELRHEPGSPPVLLTRPAEAEPPAALRELADDVLQRPPDPSRWLATIVAWSRAAARLRESRAEAESWRVIFDAIEEGMAMVGPDGRIRWCNAAMAALLGSEPSALLGRSLTERAAHLIPPGRTWPVDRTLRGGVRSRDEWEVGRRWYRSTAAPVRDARGALSGVVATIEDVSAEVRLRQRIAQVEAEAAARSERIDRLEREARLYQALAGLPIRPEERGSPRRPPLSRQLPEVFCDALEDFGRVLDLRLLRRGYQTDGGPDDAAILTGLAERLAAAGAGPRDVVELHAMALRQRSSGSRPAKANAYAEEAQVATLELMGRLVEHYRAGLAAATRPGPVASGRSPERSE